MSTIFLGVGFIAIGVLINLFPNLIAGISTLSQKERENVKTNRLARYMLIGFSMMGLVIIVGSFIGPMMEAPSLSKNINVFVILTGAVVMIIFGQKYKIQDPEKFQDKEHATLCNLDCCMSNYARQSNRSCKYCIKQ